ncbi:MAG: hypothetical protein WCH02_04785 [Pseudomonadota bacterium]
MNKKIILLTTLMTISLLSIVNYSCKRESITKSNSSKNVPDYIRDERNCVPININDDKIKNVVYSESFINKLNQKGLSYTGVFKKLTKDNSEMYVCELKSNNRDIVSTSLVLYSSENYKIIVPLLIRTTESEFQKEFELKSFTDDERLVAQITFYLNNSNGGPSYVALPCNQQGLSYGGCVQCAWNDLGSTTSGNLAEFYFGEVCLAACALHCAMGVAIQISNLSDIEIRAWITDNVGTNKLFESSEEITLNSSVTFILN